MTRESIWGKVYVGSAYGLVKPYADRLLVQEYAADDANKKDFICTAVLSPTLTIALEDTGNSQFFNKEGQAGFMSLFGGLAVSDA